MPAYNLNETVTTLEGEPMRAGETMSFERPQTLMLNGDPIENVLRIVRGGGEALTFHKMFKVSLSQDFGPQDPRKSEYPDMDVRVELLTKLVADTNVELDPEKEIPKLLDAVKIVQGTVPYMKAKEFLYGNLNKAQDDD